MDKILIIEDNKDLNTMLVKLLQDAGYDTFSALDGLNGLKLALNGTFDLILLDIVLPFKSGDQVLKELRKVSDIPVIIISAKDMIGTKIDLLKLGADDYVTKPFDLGEIEARVETNLRRKHNQDNRVKQFNFKDIILEEDGKKVSVHGTDMELTSKEYSILELLMKNQKKIFSKANLYETVWGEEYLGDDSSIKSHISRLRTKLKDANENEEYIETVWGMGYRLKT